MAWGWKFGNETGKIILTLFRLAVVIFGTWYLGRIVKQHYHRGFIVCASLIHATVEEPGPGTETVGGSIVYV